MYTAYLQTVFVTWVRASLEVHLKSDLWDELYRIGKTFSCWEELIKEWAVSYFNVVKI